MARIRTIKPEFFTSADVFPLSPLARLLFIATWCEADREGRLVWNLRTLKTRYLPEDDCDIDALAEELTDAGLVQVYDVDGRTIASIPTFSFHQNINPRESASRLPAPSKARVTDASLRVGDAQRGREGKGREGKGIDPPLPPADAGGISPLVPIPSDAEEQDATGPLLQLRALQARQAPKRKAKPKLPESSEMGARVIARINEIAGTAYRASPHLEARIAEGVPESDLLAVVESKGRDDWWLRTVRLRPSSLFRPGPFAEHLGEAKGAPPPASSRPHRHDGLERIDPPRRQRQIGDQSVHRCAICPAILPHTWGDTGWTPDPHTCAEGAMETTP